MGTPGPLTPPLLDNFQCYSVRPSRGTPGFTPIRGVQVTDGLETVSVDLIKPVTDPNTPSCPECGFTVLQRIPGGQIRCAQCGTQWPAQGVVLPTRPQHGSRYDLLK